MPIVEVLATPGRPRPWGAAMTVTLTDEDIARLLAEPKSLPFDWRKRLDLKSRSGHGEQQMEFVGTAGSTFRVILRQSEHNQFDFSAILAYCLPESSGVFRLCRCNGKSHEHTNRIERNRFYDFHIHSATERYQELGGKEDGYAEPYSHYSDLRGALLVLCRQCNIDVPEESQLRFEVE
jgi:hypothetical protein